MVGKIEDKVVRGETVEIKVMCMRLKNALCNMFFRDLLTPYVLREMYVQTRCFFGLGLLSSSLNLIGSKKKRIVVLYSREYILPPSSPSMRPISRKEISWPWGILRISINGPVADFFAQKRK